MTWSRRSSIDTGLEKVNMSIFSCNIAVRSGDSNLSLLNLKSLLKEWHRYCILQEKPSVYKGKCGDNLRILKHCRYNLKHIRRGELKCRIDPCKRKSFSFRVNFENFLREQTFDRGQRFLQDWYRWVIKKIRVNLSAYII